MSIIQTVTEHLEEVTRWRRHLHTIPELGFEEQDTAAFIAERLREFGLDPQSGIAKTGVIAALRKGASGKVIALRADIDALPITELNEFAHKSTRLGKMHACGHDGHMAMLLGAAKVLSSADSPDFDGTVVFVFQPAEEGGGGGRVMVEEGLFDRFNAHEVYGLHNLPGLPVGQMAVRVGPIMASADEFSITVSGQGGHAAMPHTTKDPVPVAAQIIQAVQALTAREVDPLDSVVISLTGLHADGGSAHIIPDHVTLRGTVRALTTATRDRIVSRLKQMAEGIAQAAGQSAALDYIYGYPVTINSAAEAGFAAEAAAAVCGADSVDTACNPLMAAEDFAYMLNERPGAYLFLGNGAPGGAGSANLHSAGYDFNDDAAAFGVAYWVELVRQRLSSAEPGS